MLHDHRTYATDAMSVRFSSEPSSAADRQVDYTFTYADDEHAPAAAPKGANHQYLQVKQVVLSVTHNIVTFYLQESVAIELGQTSNGMGHACSCAEYEADSPCSVRYQSSTVLSLSLINALAP
jgi:hypothetical protein